uniref:Uncharacterized protein n=1 Tax=Xiphophorus couchianus TaxID=32473 RepID=A0A3B5MP32_9TELE
TTFKWLFGLWLNFQDNARDMFNVNNVNKARIDSNIFYIVVYILVILGSVMVALGIFGEHAACNDNKIALQVVRFLIFIKVNIRSEGFDTSYSNQLYSDVYKLYEKNKDETVAATLKFVHDLVSAHCNGRKTETHLILETPKLKTLSVIPSPFQATCQESIESFIEKRAPLVTGAFVGTGALLVGKFCPFCLGKNISPEIQP